MMVLSGTCPGAVASPSESKAIKVLTGCLPRVPQSRCEAVQQTSAEVERAKANARLSVAA